MKKQGFSLVELLVSVMVISIIAVAFMPIVTKRIQGGVIGLKKQEDGQEQSKDGKKGEKLFTPTSPDCSGVDGYASCTFKVPEGVTKLGVVVVGSGAGGGGALSGTQKSESDYGDIISDRSYSDTENIEYVTVDIFGGSGGGGGGMEVTDDGYYFGGGGASGGGQSVNLRKKCYIDGHGCNTVKSFVVHQGANGKGGKHKVDQDGEDGEDGEDTTLTVTRCFDFPLAKTISAFELDSDGCYEDFYLVYGGKGGKAPKYELVDKVIYGSYVIQEYVAGAAGTATILDKTSDPTYTEYRPSNSNYGTCYRPGWSKVHTENGIVTDYLPLQTNTNYYYYNQCVGNKGDTRTISSTSYNNYATKGGHSFRGECYIMNDYTVSYSGGGCGAVIYYHGGVKKWIEGQDGKSPDCYHNRSYTYYYRKWTVGGTAGGGGFSGGMFHVTGFPVTPGDECSVQVGIGGTGGTAGSSPESGIGGVASTFSCKQGASWNIVKSGSFDYRGNVATTSSNGTIGIYNRETGSVYIPDLGSSISDQYSHNYQKYLDAGVKIVKSFTINADNSSCNTSGTAVSDGALGGCGAEALNGRYTEAAIGEIGGSFTDSYAPPTTVTQILAGDYGFAGAGGAGGSWKKSGNNATDGGDGQHGYVFIYWGYDE